MEVITQVKQKSEDGSSYSSPIYLGAEQRFITSLRASHNDNLEEQSILGVDCVTTEEWDGTTHIITKEFHDGNQSTNYYKLKIYIYNENVDTYINGNAIIFSNYDNVISNNFTTIRKETLSFINSKGVEIEISTKLTQQKIVNGVISTKEVIERKENINGD